MSSFQYSDNFSGFNDLINRVDFLAEARKFGDYHKSFGGLRKTLVTAGRTAATLDTITFIRKLLFTLNIISHDEMQAAKRGGIKGKGDNLLALLDDNKKEIDSRRDEIADEVEEEMALFLNRTGTDRQKTELYNARANELAKDIKAGVDVGDAVQGAVVDIEKEIDDMKKRIPDLPFDDVDVYLGVDNKDEVAANIVDKINKFYKDFTAVVTPVGLNIEGPIGAFGGEVKINDQMNRLITKYFPAVEEKDIQVALNTSAEEDLEMPLYGDEAGNSYAENEVEEDEVDDLIMNNDKEAFILTVTDSVKRALKKALNRKGILFNDVEEGLTVAPEDNEFVQRVKNKISNGYTEEEEFRESYTDGYMSDQSSSDKRNKKKEVLSESFKDRYKPKTHWQLEELRRYGL